MKKHLLYKSALAAALLATGSGMAQAAVITFDDGLDTSAAAWAPLITLDAVLYQGGFLIGPTSMAPDAGDEDLVGVLVDGSDVAGTCIGIVCPTNNPSNFYAALNDSAVYLAEASDSGVPFTLSGFKASFVGNGIDPLPTGGAAGVLRVLEVQVDGGVVSEDFQLAPAGADGSLSFNSYVPALAGQPLVAAVFLAFYCDAHGACADAFTNNKAQFALDDLVVSAVPEPANWAMLASGLAGIVGLARVRRRCAAVAA